MRKAKMSLGLAALYIGAQIIVANVTASFTYNGEEWDKQEITTYPRGKITEFTSKEEFCKR